MNEDFPPYPSGLRLQGRRVLVVGGGHVAQRRIPRLLASGADVVVVSPVTTPAVEGLAGSGEVTWHERGFEPGDVDAAWYVIAATDDTGVNDQVSAACEEQRIFCVRARRRHPRLRLDTGGRPARGRHRRGARQPRAAQVGRDPRRDRRRAA